MVRLTCLEPPGLAPATGYSHAVVSDGTLVHVAGQVALDERGETVGIGDFGAQVERALANLDLALAAAGATFGSVAAMTIYVAAHVGHVELEALREPLRRRAGSARPPAITLLFVHALTHPDWLVEVQGTAVLDRNTGGEINGR